LGLQSEPNDVAADATSDQNDDDVGECALRQERLTLGQVSERDCNPAGQTNPWAAGDRASEYRGTGPDPRNRRRTVANPGWGVDQARAQHQAHRDGQVGDNQPWPAAGRPGERRDREYRPGDHERQCDQAAGWVSVVAVAAENQ